MGRSLWSWESPRRGTGAAQLPHVPSLVTTQLSVGRSRIKAVVWDPTHG